MVVQGESEDPFGKLIADIVAVIAGLIFHVGVEAHHQAEVVRQEKLEVESESRRLVVGFFETHLVELDLPQVALAGREKVA